MNLRMEPGFLGTNASLLADLTLLAYILILLPLMAVGFFYARRKWFEPHHKYVMTSITLLNWLLILFVMASSFATSVAPNIPKNLNQLFVLFPAIHIVTGGLAQLIATYLVIRMWFENQLPDGLKVKNIKLYMRTTLFLWVVTALLGITIYITWYGNTSAGSTDDVPPPVATDEVVPDPVTTDEAAENATEEVLVPVTTDEADEAEESTEEASAPVATDEADETEETEEAPAPVATDEPEDAVQESTEKAPAPMATDEPEEMEDAIEMMEMTEEPDCVEPIPMTTEESTEEVPAPVATDEVDEATEEVPAPLATDEVDEATEEVSAPVTTDEPEC